jgi:hypothetical protein
MFVEMLGRIVDEKEATRKVQFALIGKIYSTKVFEAMSLEAGLEQFFDECYDDLKMDIPMLGTILSEEFIAAVEGSLSNPAGWRARAS